MGNKNVMEKKRCEEWSECEKTEDMNHISEFFHPCPNKMKCSEQENEYHRNCFVHPCPQGESCPDFSSLHRQIFIHDTTKERSTNSTWVNNVLFTDFLDLDPRLWKNSVSASWRIERSFRGRYSGKMGNNGPEGLGLFICSFYRYEGSWLKGKKEGSGTMKFFDTESIRITEFSGVWKGNKPIHKAKLFLDNGEVYEGQVNKTMIPHGKGSLRTLDGNLMTGNFNFGMKDGLFECVSSDGGSRFEHWEKDEKKRTLFSEEYVRHLIKKARRKSVSFIETESDQGEVLSQSTIDPNQILIGDMIGGGGFGTVYKGFWTRKKGDQIPVAIKKVTLQASCPLKKVLNEIIVNMKLSSPYVVTIYGFVCFQKGSGKEVWIVQELMAMDLLQFVQKYDIEKKKTLEVMKCMAECIQFIHSKNVLHRDIKSRNYLTNEDGSIVKVCDFGFAKMKSSSVSVVASKRKLGTVGFFAPEVMEHNIYSDKSDVYSLGVAFYEVLFRNDPNKGQKGDIYGDRICLFYKYLNMGKVVEKMKPVYWKGLDRNQGQIDHLLYTTVKKMWRYKGKERPTVDQVIDVLDTLISRCDN